jgi:hypothetical protein
MLGLLEDFAAGRRSGRSMLAEFQRAEAAFAGERPGPAGRASQGLRELVNHLGPAGARAPRRWTESVRRALTGGPPEWERLRQIGRDRGRPVPEWEIFHGLHRLATGKVQRGRRDERPLTVESIESAMELEGGLGQSWSLHRIAELRGRGEDGSAVARNAEADGPPLHGRRSAGLPAERRRSPRADLLTHVVQSDIARRPFAEADIEPASEIVDLVFGLCRAGIETTAGLHVAGVTVGQDLSRHRLPSRRDGGAGCAHLG